MNVPRAAALALAVLVSCGGPDEQITPPAVDGRPPPPAGPFGALPVGQDIAAPGLSAPVHTARDRHGIMHIQAETIRDLGYAQGYVVAHDRLPQLDILRRFGEGTLGELFGAVDQGAVETDLEMRVHRMRPLAQATWDMLKASANPDDQQIVEMFEGFAAGVNAAAKGYLDGTIPLDDALAGSFSPSTFRAWTPVDSLVLGRFQAFSLSWTAPIEITITEVYQEARRVFDAAQAGDVAAFARRGISKDLLVIKPVGRVPTINGFPNVGTDTGTRADFGRPSTLLRLLVPALDRVAATPAPATLVQRPYVPPALLRSARRFFAPTMAQGPHAFMAPRAGSNDWVVGPTLAGGKTLIAGDQHLSLPNPSIFYPVHLTVPGQLDVFGQTFPGIPGIILGSNGKAAWTSTVVFHDVNDVYLETIAPCPTGGGECVMHDGQAKKIEPWTETVRVGALGTIVRELDVTYENVPHHGPIIPEVVDGAVVPRTGNRALSVRYTGYTPTFEIRAIWRLAKAQTVDGAFKALADFSYGGQNWVVIDNQGNIGWTTTAKVPVRKAAAYTWNPTSNPTGLAPFFVLPGDGSADWESFLSSRYVPHAINPAQGFLTTANSDPVGETFDGNALNGPTVDGRPLFVSATYAAGVRTERIDQLIRAADAAGDVDLDDLAAIQHDARSNMGFHLRPAIIAALAYAADPTGAPADVATYLASLSVAQRARLTEARTKLAAWTLATPPAVAATATAQERDDSASTAIFNVWMHYFIEQTLGDEYAALGMSVWDLEQNLTARVVHAVLVEPAGLVLSPTTTQPIVCDEMATAGADASCTKKILEAMLAAMTQLDTQMASADVATWRWGKLHTLTLRPLFPEARLNLPAPDSSQPGGYPKPGDNFAVNRADCGWEDLDFRQDGDGPAQRFLAEASPGMPIKVKLQFAGGTVFNRASPHYKDVLERNYIAEQHFDLPFSVAEIVAAGEERWVLRP